MRTQLCFAVAVLLAGCGKQDAGTTLAACQAKSSIEIDAQGIRDCMGENGYRFKERGNESSACWDIAESTEPDGSKVVAAFPHYDEVGCYEAAK